MSVDRNALMFLARAKANGVSFARPATIGRQGLAASSAEVRHAMSLAGVGSHPDEGAERPALWLDSVLEAFGAEEVVSVDASDYEGASYVHDLNCPVPMDLEAKFTVVIDVGTLEHVFDFPTAIRNLMRMVQVGGMLILVTPTNNEAGHGFYQFSPELLFRVLNRSHGFEVEDMLLRELGRPLAHWYRVCDPDAVGRRAQFRSRYPSYLFVRARRIGDVPEFAPPPQQSDYAAAWTAGTFPETAQPTRRLALASIGSFVAHTCNSGGAFSRVLSRPIGWARQQRMFQRIGYGRLHSHFLRLGRQDPP
jgi:hypothetical protein